VSGSGDADSPPQPPERPGPDECCHSGCQICVFDLYEEKLARYLTELHAWEVRRDRKQAPEN
jgi:hypothetical protein